MGGWLPWLLACLATDAGGLTTNPTSAPLAVLVRTSDRQYHSPGCAHRGTPHEPGSTRDIQVGEGPRSAKLFIPSGYRAGRKHPLLLSFHDYTSSAEEQASLDTFVELAEREKFLVVYPDGSEDVPEGWNRSAPMEYAASSWRSWNGAGSTGSPGTDGHTCDARRVGGAYPCYRSCGPCKDPCWWTTCADDAGFVAALLDQLEETLCVDKSRIYGAGFGNGGKLVFELGAHKEVAGRFEALAAVAGLPHVGFPNMGPPRRSAPRLLGIWGVHDGLVPPLPGAASNRTDRTESTEGFFYLSAPRAMDVWSRTMGMKWSLSMARPNHTDAGFAAHPLGSPECSAMGGRGPRKRTQLAACLWSGRHEWPHFATRYIWRFLSYGSLPSVEPGGAKKVRVAAALRSGGRRDGNEEIGEGDVATGLVEGEQGGAAHDGRMPAS